MGPEWPTGCTTAPGATTSSRSVHSLLHCLLSCFCSFVSAPVFCSPCKTSLTTLLTGTGPSWELHGPRVAHRLHHRTRCHNIKQICTLFTALSSLMLLLICQRTSVLQSLQNKPDHPADWDGALLGAAWAQSGPQAAPPHQVPQYQADLYTLYCTVFSHASAHSSAHQCSAVLAKQA